jgi:hypothetical protein
MLEISCLGKAFVKNSQVYHSGCTGQHYHKELTLTSSCLSKYPAPIPTNSGARWLALQAATDLMNLSSQHVLQDATAEE